MQNPEMIVSHHVVSRQPDEALADAVALVQQPPPPRADARREDQQETAGARPGRRRVPRMFAALAEYAEETRQEVSRMEPTLLLLAILGVEPPPLCGQSGEPLDTESEVGDEHITVQVRRALLRWYRTLPPHRRARAVEIALNLVGSPTSHEVRLAQRVQRATCKLPTRGSRCSRGSDLSKLGRYVRHHPSRRATTTPGQ